MNHDILFNILLNSDINTITVLSQTNKTVNQICNNNFFW